MTALKLDLGLFLFTDLNLNMFFLLQLLGENLRVVSHLSLGLLVESLKLIQVFPLTSDQQFGLFELVANLAELFLVCCALVFDLGLEFGLLLFFQSDLEFFLLNLSLDSQELLIELLLLFFQDEECIQEHLDRRFTTLAKLEDHLFGLSGTLPQVNNLICKQTHVVNHVIQVLLHRLFVLGKLSLRALNALELQSEPVELLADFIGLLLRFLSRSLVFGNDLRELLVGSLQVLVLRLECLVFFYQSTDELLRRS